jgi:acyl carrier protein
MPATNEADVRKTVLAILCEVAPDVEPDDIDPSADLREETDIDSMDFLNVMIGIKRELGVEVPESDYRELGSLDQVVEYVSARVGPSQT